jgi:microcystin-dependent protein
MSEPFIGQIEMTGYNYAPQGWALCNGQLLSIAQNTALFSLLGTTYGGNGQTTFGLPDLRGRMPVHQGQGPGLSNRVMGEAAGSETVTLNQGEMPQHNHTVAAQSGPGNSTNPSNNFPAASSARDNIYSNSSNALMNQMEIGLTGGSQPHDNMPPFLTVNFIIALQGIYPSRS